MLRCRYFFGWLNQSTPANYHRIILFSATIRGSSWLRQKMFNCVSNLQLNLVFGESPQLQILCSTNFTLVIIKQKIPMACSSPFGVATSHKDVLYSHTRQDIYCLNIRIAYL